MRAYDQVPTNMHTLRIQGPKAAMLEIERGVKICEKVTKFVQSSLKRDIFHTTPPTLEAVKGCC